ncbi:MAG: RNA polymerase sigma factor CarQ [Planctomycetes bacterium]|nr:RNA polymerase sigma factor CarQ [Planctomycetota bacterium]
MAPLPTVTRAASPDDGDVAPLVVRARGGDAAAFAELHRRFAPVVHGIALAHLRRSGGRALASEADDVTQDVFARVLRSLGTLREPAAFPGWICEAARNAARDAARAARRRPEVAEPRDVASPAPAHDDASAERRERLLAEIAKLPDAYRETLLMRLAEGLTGREIAARTGLAEGSVRVNLCRGMAMLRPRLERLMEDER